MSFHLNDVLGAKGEQGLSFLLALIDPGPYRDISYQGPKIRDIREWVELTRRLMLPYYEDYEEARIYMDRADTDGFFDGYPARLIYFPETLQLVIVKYSSADC
jgi:hypothetical protein